MSKIESCLKYNEIDNEYNCFGDTRNEKKYNEEKFYWKHSYNKNDISRIKYVCEKKQHQSECAFNEHKNEENEENEKNKKSKKNKKREIKKANEEDENYGNNCEEIQKKPKKKKIPKKDRVRF